MKLSWYENKKGCIESKARLIERMAADTLLVEMAKTLESKE